LNGELTFSYFNAWEVFCLYLFLSWTQNTPSEFIHFPSSLFRKYSIPFSFIVLRFSIDEIAGLETYKQVKALATYAIQHYPQ